MVCANIGFFAAHRKPSPAGEGGSRRLTDEVVIKILKNPTSACHPERSRSFATEEQNRGTQFRRDLPRRFADFFRVSYILLKTGVQRTPLRFDNVLMRVRSRIV